MAVPLLSEWYRIGAAASQKHESRQMPNDDGGEGLAPGLILGVEPREIGTVEIQHTDDLAVSRQWDDEFGAGCGVAGDMAGKRLHVRDKDRPPLARGSAAHAGANRDAHA